MQADKPGTPLPVSLPISSWGVGCWRVGAWAMGRKKNRLPPFVPILKDMIQGEAWEAISNPARVAYVHLKSKCFSASNAEITLSFKEMERIMDRHTFSSALNQLEEHGFIIKTQKGGLFRKRNYFKIIDQWRSFRMKKTG